MNIKELVKTKEFRYALFPSWVGVAFFLLLNICGLLQENIFIFSILIILGVLFGIPHGALDHFVPFDLTKQKITAKPMTYILVVYIGLFFLNVALWFCCVEAAALLFFLITLFHFGQTELYSQKKFLNLNYLKGRLLSFYSELIRGSVPMFIPLFFYSYSYKSLMEKLGMKSTLSFFVKYEDELFWVYVFLLVTYFLVGLYLSAKDKLQSSWIADTSELFLLIVFFIFVKPIFSLGLYLFLWHSLRHLMRLYLINDEFKVTLFSSGLIKTQAKYLLKALPTLSLATIFMMCLYPLFPQFKETPLQIFLIFISSVTVPHTVLIVWMDMKERIYN